VYVAEALTLNPTFMYARMLLLHNSAAIIDMQNSSELSQHKLTLLTTNMKFTLTIALYYNHFSPNCEQPK
jgi:hypothetical protein